MTTWYEWRIKCSTDNQWYKVITKNQDEPTICPQNSAHTVVSGSGLIINRLAQASPRLTLPDEDGRLIVSPGLYPDFLNQCFTSESDNIASGLRGGGNKFITSMVDGSTSTTTEYRFVDYCQILGGDIRVFNANINDRFSTDVYAEASPVVANVSNLGNCNLIDLEGGAHMIVPANGDGTHDVDLTEAENSNVEGDPTNPLKPIFISKVSPIPSRAEDNTPTGYWDWSRHTGQVTPVPDGKGSYNLFDYPMVLLKYVNKISVYGNSHPFKQSLLLNHRGGPFLPHWRIRTTCTRTGHPAEDPPVIYTITVVVARKYSTNPGDT